MIQRPYFIPILALVAHTYTIHTCIYTVYIPILYLFYTRILFFFTVLHFKKYIYDPTSYLITRVNLYRIKQIWTVSSRHVTYTFQTESTLYSCLNVKELVA